MEGPCVPLSRLGAAKAHAAAIRSELARRGAPHAKGLGDARLHRLAVLVISKGGTTLDAADSLTIFPRPGWVADICGVFPLSLELTCAEDIAPADEWGHSGQAPE